MAAHEGAHPAAWIHRREIFGLDAQPAGQRRDAGVRAIARGLGSAQLGRQRRTHLRQPRRGGERGARRRRAGAEAAARSHARDLRGRVAPELLRDGVDQPPEVVVAQRGRVALGHQLPDDVAERGALQDDGEAAPLEAEPQHPFDVPARHPHAEVAAGVGAGRRDDMRRAADGEVPGPRRAGGEVAEERALGVVDIDGGIRHRVRDTGGGIGLDDSAADLLEPEPARVELDREAIPQLGDGQAVQRFPGYSAEGGQPCGRLARDRVLGGVGDAARSVVCHDVFLGLRVERIRT